MSASGMFLSEASCPLVPLESRRELVERFNFACELLECAVTLASSGVLSERIEQASTELHRIRELLQRPTYRVGFLGPFQAGKSTTFNNVLGVLGTGQEPAGVGQGFPTTAVITRLLKSADAEHHIRPAFLTKHEYQEKRRYLCKLCGFDPASDDRTILRDIPLILRNWQKDVRVWKDASGNETPVKRRDVEYLSLMLRSFGDYGEYIKEQRFVLDKVPFNERLRYLTHPADPWHEQPSVLTPLLHEVEMHYCTDVIPPTLEMLDLPGYDGDCSVDAFLTDHFLKSLEAALVFCRATDFGGIVETIVSNLRRVLGNDLRGRVWLVVTRCDSIRVLGATAGDERSIFERIRIFGENKGIPPEQVLFVTNDLEGYRACMQDTQFRQLIADAIEAAAGQWPQIREQWQALEEDGGLKHLRYLIARKMADDVSRSIASSVSSRLNRLCESLYNLIKRLGEDFSLNQLPEKFVQWRTKLSEHTILEPVQVKELKNQIRSDLLARWEKSAPTVNLLDHIIAANGNEGLKEEFLVHMDFMDHALMNGLQDQWIEAAYRRLTEMLRCEEHADGMLQLPGICENGLAALFEEFCEQDRKNIMGWADNQLPLFKTNSPFDDLERDAEPIFTGQEYLNLVSRKIDAVSWQVALLLNLRIRQRIQHTLEHIRQHWLQLSQRGKQPTAWNEEISRLEDKYLRLSQS